MKKTLLAILLFLVFLSTEAQFRVFFPRENAYFSINDEKLFISGDTLINNKLYIKTHIQRGDSIPDFSQTIYFGCFREDTLNEKIYSIIKGDSVEKLLYDFKVKVGDTAKVVSYWGASISDIGKIAKRKVTKVDTIALIGKNRKRIQFERSWNDEDWIEGIGSTNGLFYPIYNSVSDMTGRRLLCLNVNDNLVLSPSILYGITYLNCYFSDEPIDRLPINISKKLDSVVNLFPNPVIEKFKIDSDIKIDQVNIYSALGLKLATFKSAEINISNFEAGMYIVEVTLGNQQKIKNKLIKL